MMQKQANGITRFQVKCIKNEGYVGSLIVGHYYEAFLGPDGVLGVIDEEKRLTFTLKNTLNFRLICNIGYQAIALSPLSGGIFNGKQK